MDCQDDLSEIKWNLKRLFKKMGYKYTKRVSSPNSNSSSNDSDHLTDSSDSRDDYIHEVVQVKERGL